MTTPAPVPKLGLVEMIESDLPYLEVVVRNTKGDTVANVVTVRADAAVWSA